MTGRESSAPARLILTMTAFVALGTPLTLYAWHVLSEALAGRFAPRPVGVALIFVGSFLLLARVLGRRLQRVAGS